MKLTQCERISEAFSDRGIERESESPTAEFVAVAAGLY